MARKREEVCGAASKQLAAAAGTLPRMKALIGCDGFVDNIIAVVDKRQDLERYEPVKTIEQFGKKVLAAAGQSSNYEMVVTVQKLGGNGPIMANALASAGMAVTYFGNLGYPSIHPVFEEFCRRAEVISIAEPGQTDALEFTDGKLMLGKHQTLKDINWENIIARVGKDKLQKLVRDAKLIGMVNWTMLPFMSHIWERLVEEILPGINRHDRRLFVDLADPEKRTHEDILAALRLLSRFQEHVDVILGLNLKECSEVLEVLGLPAPADAEGAIEQSAKAIREKLKLSCVVVHPRKGAAAAIEGESATFAGPFVQEPKISTGAGDHFNAGFCLGRVLGLKLDESLCVGVSTSGYYVRTAISPSASELAEFIAKLPPPQG